LTGGWRRSAAWFSDSSQSSGSSSRSWGQESRFSNFKLIEIRPVAARAVLLRTARKARRCSSVLKPVAAVNTTHTFHKYSFLQATGPVRQSDQQNWGEKRSTFWIIVNLLGQES
jgi:hypothetical protein